jgi:recombination protein RecT
MAENRQLPTLKEALKMPSVVNKFTEMLGKRAPQFMTSITSVVGNNDLLKKADVNSIIMGSALAASMDLPLNPNLGYCALVPFNSKQGCFAQMQIMTRGYVELFLRSGQCQSLINECVYEGQLVKKNKFTGEYIFEEDAKKSNKIIGYMAYFKLTNGYEKTEYWTIQEVKEHALKFSKTYKQSFGIWKDNFDSMAKKTVLKSLLVKYAPKSIELQKGFMYDQAVISGDIDNIEDAKSNYIDNDKNGEPTPSEEYTNFEEVQETVDTDTGEIKEEQKEQPKDEEF